MADQSPTRDRRAVASARLLAAAVAGVALASGFPPYEWTLVAWAGLIAFVWLVLTADSMSLARWSGFLFALAFFGFLLRWLSEVELLAYYPMVVLQSLPMIVVGASARRFRDRSPTVVVLAVAGSFALAEFVRVRWPYGGFPWGAPGLTVSSTPLRPSAQFIGTSGWTVLLAAMAAVIVLAALRRIGTRPVLIGAGLVTLLGVAGNVWPAVPAGETRRVTIVQGNSPCPGTRCPDERALIFDSHLELTRTIEPGTTDLVIWPESSTGGASDPVLAPEVGALVAAEAARIGAPLLVGGDRSAGPENFINVNVVFDAGGQYVGEYRKRHPVPFGEYVPLRSVLDWIPALDRVPRDLLPGDEPVLFDAGGVPFASVISYEGAFARYERDSVGAGARLLVVATNEASFGDSPSSDQFIAISRLRAAELGTDIVHAAVTGRSAVVRADGSVAGLTDLFERTLVVGEVRARSAGATLYARWGDWVQVLALLGFLVLIVWDRFAGLAGNRGETGDVQGVRPSG